MTGSNKGHNTQKGDYHEVFEMACDNDQTCRKWMILIKWLIRKHLIALS